MRKLIPIIALLICLFASPAFAACTSGPWYAGHTGNIDGSSTGATWYIGSGGSCTGSSTQLTWANHCPNDIFYANGCSSVAVNVDPAGTTYGTITLAGTTFAVVAGQNTLTCIGGACNLSGQISVNDWIYFAGQPPLQVNASAAGWTTTSITLAANAPYSFSAAACYDGIPTLTTAAGSGTAGGGFTYATAAQLTMHSHFTAGTTPALAISGSQSGTAGTIYGNATGGGTASGYGISDSHTVGTINFFGNMNGGTAAATYGYAVVGVSPVTAVGTATGGNGAGTAYGLNQASTGAVAITGPGTTPTNACVGGVTTDASGCIGAAGAGITVIGNIINSVAATGVRGRIYWQPTASNYVLFANDSSYATGTINTHAVELSPNAAGNTGSSTYLPVGNVLSGGVFGTLTGTYTDPGIANVKLGVNYGAGGTGEQGTYNIPHSYGY